MKKLIMILALVATSAFAEPSFNQVQDLIGRQQYAAAGEGYTNDIRKEDPKKRDLKKEAKDRDKRREARRKKIAKENNLLYIKK